MQEINVTVPASGCRLLNAGSLALVFGQPPEVLKGLLRNQVESFDGLVLIDSRERDGSLLNHIEFLLYHFLFQLGGHQASRKLHLIGDNLQLDQVKRVLQLCLLGPDSEQFSVWQTDPALAQEWLRVAEASALKDASQHLLTIDDLVETHVFENDQVTLGDVTLSHTGWDQYRVEAGGHSINLDLGEDQRILPSYPFHRENHPTPLAKLSLEVLGGASGFSPDEPCTGLALCYNGEYMLIDVLPFLDEHLLARGISKNQISSCFLTHVHDDHCAMLPLMQSSRKIEIISTPEIYQMALEKLALSLDWRTEVIAEHFEFTAIRPGEVLNHYGLMIEAHLTVHSIPTIGATFSVTDAGVPRRVCVIGDNHALKNIEPLVASGAVREETLDRLQRIYATPYDLLIADGGAGILHGDPEELTDSPADRVVFVHVDELATAFSATFSLANAGKRYTLIEGTQSLYGALIHHYLKHWIDPNVSDRWLRNLVTDSRIKHYNLDDVILVQGQPSRGNIYLILTGYCKIVRHENDQLNAVATLQAGDLIGEMAALTDLGARNASVVAQTPVIVCQFSEDVFTALAASPAFHAELNKRWQLRPLVKRIPPFQAVSATVIERITTASNLIDYQPSEEIVFAADHRYFRIQGSMTSDNPEIEKSDRLGVRTPFTPLTGTAIASTHCQFLSIPDQVFEQLCLDTPQLNYQYRKFMQQLPSVG